MEANTTLELLKVVMGPLLTALFGLAVAFWLRHWWFDEERHRRGRNDTNTFMEELWDLERHFLRNKQVLEVIFREAHATEDGMPTFPLGRPASIHFEKMLVPPESMALRSEIFNHLEPMHVGRVNGLRIVLRNRNMEAQNLAKYVQQEDCDRATLARYIRHSYDVAENEVVHRIRDARRAMGNHKPDQQERPDLPEIIYHDWSEPKKELSWKYELTLP